MQAINGVSIAQHTSALPARQPQAPHQRRCRHCHPLSQMMAGTTARLKEEQGWTRVVAGVTVAHELTLIHVQASHRHVQACPAAAGGVGVGGEMDKRSLKDTGGVEVCAGMGARQRGRSSWYWKRISSATELHFPRTRGCRLPPPSSLAGLHSLVGECDWQC